MYGRCLVQAQRADDGGRSVGGNAVRADRQAGDDEGGGDVREWTVRVVGGVELRRKVDVQTEVGQLLGGFGRRKGELQMDVLGSPVVVVIDGPMLL